MFFSGKGINMLNASQDFMSHVYRDQEPAIYAIGMGSPFHGFAAYTVYGIKKIDTGFAERIMGCHTESEAMEIEHEIQENPNLHQEIKGNLLLNLSARMRLTNEFLDVLPEQLH